MSFSRYVCLISLFLGFKPFKNVLLLLSCHLLPPTACVLLSFMPRLKETYLQIKERNRREIRNRTAARIAQLLQTTSHELEGSDEESDEEQPPPPKQTLVQFNRLPLLIFLFILLVLLLLVVHIRLRESV